ncbi:MAG: UDP-N-acetylmuramoyl-L-alanine--D-glutamate ligase [Bacteroides sp.]|nr:UDP-N-acetylmuramoyl-L-alanine--D-glutamate ligase [Bacillota bacterium]MCM1394368.1 UDP-N-acetylmuramoyl-L-alanine--D-glutamate ligase [[Eubacterium] siraeum]MCM1455031.1 UDP-N-acetylmuramoyl-L-alanine--D-glutamate ligase [Bacteroides sp.]
MKFIGKNAVVYGAGASGLSAYQLLREKGAKAIIYDDNPNIVGATNSKSVIDSADIIVLSPGVDGAKDFLLDAKLENKIVVGELELASMCCNAEQIAITGTNGKTTTTMLIDGILKRAGKSSYAVGNIGTPFSAIADKLDATEIAVIEASSFQLESSIKFSPDTAVILNIKPDHLERHGSLEKYAAAKANIFLNQGEQDYVVYNADDQVICGFIPQMVAKKVPFSVKRPIKGGAYMSSGFICFDGQPIISLDETDMRGAEIENLLAAVCVCMTQGISVYNIASGIIEFERPEYRRQKCGEIHGICVYNDSKSTNVSACISACKGIDGDCVLILGGAKRNEDFEELFKELPHNVKAVAISGENASDILRCAKNAEFENIVAYDDIKSALRGAYNVAVSSGYKNILFSPSSKSYDKFSGYEMRGKHFDACFNALRQEV